MTHRHGDDVSGGMWLFANNLEGGKPRARDPKPGGTEFAGVFLNIHAQSLPIRLDKINYLQRTVNVVRVPADGAGSP